MHTTFKNAVVGFSFLSCAMVLTAIVSLGTATNKPDSTVLSKAKTLTVTSAKIQNIK